MATHSMTNEQIVTWKTSRDEPTVHHPVDAISALATEHSTLLFRIAFSVLRHASDAEDVVQETFLRVLRHPAKLAVIGNPRIWLVRIAWNLALDRKRRQRVMPLHDEAEELLRNHPSSQTPALEAMRAAESYIRILRLLDKLPRKEREALRLSAIEELNTSEIASILHTTESSVRSCLFRARQRLRERLEAEERRHRP